MALEKRRSESKERDDRQHEDSDISDALREDPLFLQKSPPGHTELSSRQLRHGAAQLHRSRLQVLAILSSVSLRTSEW